MNRYILIPEDTIRVLPPEDGVEAAVEVFCSRTVIFFDISQIQDVCLMQTFYRTAGASMHSVSRRQTACWSGNRWCLSPRTEPIMQRF